MAGGVDNVKAGALPFHAGAFRQDGDAALALLVVGIHGALVHVLVFAHRAGLLEQLVDQGGLAMVDMGDDGNVANFHKSKRLNQSAEVRRAYRREGREPQRNRKKLLTT